MMAPGMTIVTHAIASRAGYLALAGWMLVGAGDLASGLSEHRPGATLAVAAAAVILVSALIASVAGFAFCALAGSALAWLQIDPVDAVRTMVLCSIATQAYAVWAIRAAIPWRSVCPLIVAGGLTVPAGVWLLLHSQPAIYAVGLGVFMTVYGGFYLANRRGAVIEGERPWLDITVGALGGLTGGLSGIPGAFVTIWCSMRGWDKLRQRAFYQPYILAMQVLTGASLLWTRPLAAGGVHDLQFVPFALLGAIGGMALFRRLTMRQFQVTVSVLLLVSGVGLLSRVVR
jgi:uncharacterized protein